MEVPGVEQVVILSICPQQQLRLQELQERLDDLEDQDEERPDASCKPAEE